MPDLHHVPPFLSSELVTATFVAFTEGPAADANGDVYFTDIVNNRILKHTPGARFEVFRADSGRTNGLLFDPQGRLLACEGNEFGTGGRRRITRTDLGTGSVEVLTDHFEGEPYNAPNDIAALSNGLIFFTDPCYWDRSTMKLSHDSVYRIEPDGVVTKAISQPDIQRPNGIAISPDERTLYLVDSCPVPGGNRKIWAFDLDPKGTPTNQRLVYDFAPGRGGDGMAVDQQGTLYIAAGIRVQRGPHETTDVPPAIYVIKPDGTLIGSIPVGEDVITNVTFGGPDLKTLYITAGKTLFTTPVPIPGFVIHRNLDGTPKYQRAGGQGA